MYSSLLHGLVLSTCGMKLPLLTASYAVYKRFSSQKLAKMGGSSELLEPPWLQA